MQQPIGRGLAALGLVAILATACGATGSVATNGPDATTRPTSTPTTEPTDEPTTDPVAVTPDPTAEPVATDPATSASKVGEVNHITADGEDYLDITVTKPSFHTSYGSGYLKDTPQVKGNEFLQVYVSYVAKQAGASYNEFDWDVFVDDTAVDGFAYASGGPTPELGSGDLPKGRSAKGWLLFEVPKTGRVVLSYKGNFTNNEPVFEIVLRSK